MVPRSGARWVLPCNILLIASGYLRRLAIASGITIEEFERLPDALAHYYELVDGELVDVSGNTAGHNMLRDCLLVLLSPSVCRIQGKCSVVCCPS
jgi:hypothetical protein